MFAKPWSSGRTNRPGNRGSGGSTTTATTVQGSARPPNGTSGHSRQQHLDSYLKDDILGRSTMKVSQDDTTYDTVFSTVSEDTLILRVHFPAPAYTPGATTQGAPEMKLTGVVATHGWLDGIGRVVGFDPTSSDRAFRDSKLLLGHAVKQVVQELQLNPPTVTKFVDAHLAKMQKKNKSVSSTVRSSTSSNGSEPPSYETVLNGGSGHTPQPQREAPQVALPSIPSQFPALEGMEREELDELLNNEVAFLAFCNNLPVSQELESIVAEKSRETERLAEENIARQAELQELYASTRSLHEQLQSLVKDISALEKRQDALQEKPDARILIKDLTKAKKQAFDESEQLADRWLDEGDDCADSMDQFCNQFLEKRKTHHIRAAKVQILTQQQKTGTMNGPAKRL